MIESVKPAKVSLPSEREITITRTFDAPRATVFDAWTKPERVTRWWDPSRRPLARCEIDLRPNGAFRFEPQSAEGPGHVFTGIYREITPPDRLVFAIPGPSGNEVVGTLEFADNGKGTTLQITMACASQADRDALLGARVDVGTVKTLENLDEFLTSTR